MAEQPFTVDDLDVEDDVEIIGETNLQGVVTFGAGGTAFTFPNADGSANQVLKTDGSGAVTFQTLAAGGTVTSVNTANSTFITGSGGPITGSGSLTYSLSATGTPTSSNYLRGDNTWASIPSGYTSWTLTGDGGTPQTISDGNAATFTGGTGISTTASATDTLTITNTGVTSAIGGTGVDVNSGTGAVTFTIDLNELSTTTTSGDADFFSIVNSGGSQFKIAPSNILISGFNNDAGFTSNTGTVTSVQVSGGSTGLTYSGGPITGSGTITMAGTLAIGSGGTGVTNTPTAGQLLIGNTSNSDYDLANLTGGTGVTITNADGSITIAADNNGTVTSVNTANSTFISGSGGAITTSGSLTYSLSATGTPSGSNFLRGDNTWAAIPGGFTSWTLAGDSGSSQTISDGNTATFSGGTGISTVGGATDTLTITNTGVTSNLAGTGISVSGATGAVTITNSGVTSASGSTGIDVNSSTGAVTFTLDLNELTTSTSDGDGDFFAVVAAVGAQKKLTKANINLSGFNNDSGFTSNTGTVTSVGLSAPAAFSVSGSPVTGSGTLALTGAGTSSQVILGDGTLGTLPTGDITGVTAGTGLSGGGTSGTVTLNFDGNSLSASGTLVGTDDLVVVDGTTSNKTQISTIPLSIFLNDSGFTSNTGTVTSVATSSGTFVDITGGTITSSGTITGDLSATGTPSSSTFLRGDNTWASPTSSFSDFIISDGVTTQTISDGDTITFTAGTGVTAVVSATDTLTITNTGVTSAVAGTGIGVSGATGAVTITNSGVTSLAATTPINTTAASGGITISSDAYTGGTGVGYVPTGGSASTWLRGDGAWVTPGGSYAFWTLTADSGSNQNILNGNTVDIAGGTGISTVVGATDTVTITNDGVTSNVAGTGISVSGATGAVTIANTGVTSIVAGTNVSISGSTGAVTVNSTDQFTGTVTSVATSSGTFVDITGGTITSSGTITGDLSATGTPTSSNFLRGDNTWASVPGGYTSWTLAGDSGSSQTIADGNTATIAGGTGLSSVASATDTVTLSLDNTAVSAGSYTYASLTVDAQGRLTAASSGASPGTMSSFTLAGDSGSSQTITNGNTMDIAGGTGISTAAGATDTVTITNTGVTSAVAGTGISVSGATGAVTFGNTGVTSIVAGTNVTISGGTGAVTINSSDQFTGTVTSVNTANSTFISGSGGAITTTGSLTYSLSATGTPSGSTFLRGDNTWASVPGGYTSWTLAGDSGSSQTISDGNTATIAGGTGLSSVASATDTVTLNLDNTAVSAGSYTYASLTVDAQGRLTAASSGSAPDISGTIAAGQVAYGASADTIEGDNNLFWNTSTDRLGIGTATPTASLHASTSDNIVAKFVSTDATASIELADNSTSNNAVLTRVGQTLTLCANGGNVAIGNSISSYNGSAPTNGQILIGDSASGLFDAATLTAGSNISITNGAGAITINSSDQFTGTVTSVATSSGTFVNVTGGTITTSGTVTADLSATGTPSATTFLRGDNTWATPAGGGTVTSVATGTGLTGGTITTSGTLSVNVSDFMTNGANNRVLTATGTDDMNAEANMTFDGSELEVKAAAKSYRAPATIFSASGAITNLTVATHAGEYLIKTDTGGGTFNLPSAFSVGDHFTFVYAPTSTTTTTLPITIDAAAGDNITWYDGSASVYANNIQWTPKAGSAITVIGTVANSNWVAIGTDQ